MRLRFATIADDFTGACDVGVKFRKRGLETVVLTDTKGLEDLKGKFDVAIIDTETRNLAPKESYCKVRRTLKALREMGVKLAYLKIDSTLRGNIGAELDAVLNEEHGVKAVLVAPSFPAHHRTVKSGNLLVNGMLLSKTEFARDPLNPPCESNIPTLLRCQSKARVGHVDLSVVRDGFDSLAREVQETIEGGCHVAVIDAETQRDLDTIADVAAALHLLPCGSAGLAEHVARLLAPEPRLLVITGSVNTVTLGQIAMAEKELKVRVIEPDLTEVLTSRRKLTAEVERLVRETDEAFNEGKQVIIRLAKSRDEMSRAQTRGKEHGISLAKAVERLLSILGNAIREIVQKHEIASLVLIGGDTAISMVGALGAEGIRIEREVMPGVPLGWVLGGKHEGMGVVTKAGGFGASDTLIKVMRTLVKSHVLYR